jgi:uncharacterized protein YdhG (YjbR/CyaY superfamily)
VGDLLTVGRVKVNVGTVTAWLEALPPDRRAALSTLRDMIERAAPKAKGTMQYGTPSWHMGGPLFAISSHPAHMELLVAEPELVKARKKRLGNVEIGTAGFRFKRLEDLDLAGVQALLDAAAARRR